MTRIDIAPLIDEAAADLALIPAPIPAPRHDLAVTPLRRIPQSGWPWAASSLLSFALNAVFVAALVFPLWSNPPLAEPLIVPVELVRLDPEPPPAPTVAEPAAAATASPVMAEEPAKVEPPLPPPLPEPQKAEEPPAPPQQEPMKAEEPPVPAPAPAPVEPPKAEEPPALAKAEQPPPEKPPQQIAEIPAPAAPLTREPDAFVPPTAAKPPPAPKPRPKPAAQTARHAPARAPAPPPAARATAPAATRLDLTMPAAQEAALPRGTSRASPASEKDAIRSYASRMRQMIEAKKSYPAQALRRQEEGNVELHIVLERTGKVVQVTANAGSPELLVKAAMNAVKDAAPFPAFPPELNHDHVTFELPIVFKLE